MPDEACPAPPDIPLWAEAPWRAWMELSGDRPYAVAGYAAPMGGMMIQSRPLPLPWSLIQQWCDRADCSEESREFVVECVRAVDRAFLDDWTQQQKPGAPTAENSLAVKAARWDKEMEQEEAERARADAAHRAGLAKEG